MKLSGNYSLDDLVRAIQGNFSCQSETDKTDSHEFISLEYFFLRAEIDSTKNEVRIFGISEDKYGAKRLKPLVTLAGK